MTRRSIPLKGRHPVQLDLFASDAGMSATRPSAKRPQDKDRKLCVFDREMVLMDKHGVVPIHEVDDATAVHYFLQWKHGQGQRAALRSKKATQSQRAVSLKGGV